MTMLPNGQYIACDGGCGAKIPVPIGLRALLRGDAAESPPAAGWLFVSSPHGQRHYCPHCAAKYLASVDEFASDSALIDIDDGRT